MYTGAALSFGLIRACRGGLVLYCSVLSDAGGENDGSSAIFERSLLFLPLFSPKPSPKPIPTCCQLDPQQQTSVKFESKYNSFHFKKMHFKMSSAKWCPFYSGLNVLTTKLGCCFNIKMPCYQQRNSHYKYKIDGSMQEIYNAIVNTLELRLSCTNPRKWSHDHLSLWWESLYLKKTVFILKEAPVLFTLRSMI